MKLFKNAVVFQTTLCPDGENEQDCLVIAWKESKTLNTRVLFRDEPTAGCPDVVYREGVGELPEAEMQVLLEEIGEAERRNKEV